MKEKLLVNKIALVTAATQGIGLASAIKLAENGATVYLAVRRVEDTQLLIEPYRSKGFDLQVVYFDATKPETLETSIQTVLYEQSRIDILVNNYGTGKPQKDFDIVNTSEADFLQIVETNIATVYRYTQLVLPHMMAQNAGVIINISSVAGTNPDVTRVGYGVAKAGINHLTVQTAKQYGSYNIRCNAVLPGMTATTAMLDNMPAEFIEQFLVQVPLQRVGTPEDIAQAVLFLASDQASYITGALLEVAGGFVL
ncbi:MAG: 7alpha-hydroxysteroid dehydrogenase [Culicoidibacterales bacterium]